jgi:hypothetical protein
MDPQRTQPSDPMDNLAGIVFIDSGQTIPWQRDNLDIYALSLGRNCK